MTTEPVRAGADWLALREHADAGARAADLADELRAWLPRGPLEIHDLGCGTGSMARWLAPRLPGPQHWVLHDRDDELLARAEEAPRGRSADGAEVTVETRRDDITLLGPAELAGADLLTASALLDMMTAEELRRFAAVCAAPGCPVLITLSVVGRVELSPADPLDRVLTDAFNDHQRRVTGLGRLLGPDASRAAVRELAGLGRGVTVRPSPWRLGPEQAALTAEWLEGWVGAACEQRPELAGQATGYLRRRQEEAARGALSATVHHEDLLVGPAY